MSSTGAATGGSSGGGKGGSLTVAASDAPAVIKARADYVCTGTNDEVQINNALAAGLAIALTEGTFILSAPVVISRDNAALTGAGFATVIKPAAGFTASAALNATGNTSKALVVVDNGSGTQPVGHVTLQNFRVDGNNVGSVAAPITGIYFRSYHGRLRDIKVQKTSGYGIVVEGYSGWSTFDTMLVHCTTELTWLHGFYATGQRGEDLVFVSCKALTAGRSSQAVTALGVGNVASQHGFALGGASQQLIGCHPYDNGGAGIAFLTSTARHKVIGCKVEGNLYGILFAQSVSDCQIMGNNFRGAPSTQSFPTYTLPTNPMHIRLPSGFAAGEGFSQIVGNDFDPAYEETPLIASPQFAIQIGDGQAQACVITGNRFISGYTSGIIDQFGGTGLTSGQIINNNDGYVDTNGGTATIASASTSVVVTHGLSYTPSARDISVVPTNNPTTDPGNIWISNITSTQFTINCRTAPGASTATFAWHASRFGKQ